MEAWNTARVGFTFFEQPESFPNNPCHEYDGIAIILTDGEVCPGDGPMNAAGLFGPTDYEQARIYLNIGFYARGSDYNITPLLIHELGHALGLGHPDEAEQEVMAIMNSYLGVDTVQPDDIAGARALWGGPGPLVGVLENPRAGSHQSGVGVISGWVCEADTVAIKINGVPYPVPYGTARLDTEDACGDVDNGFGLLFNWNLLDDGAHAVGGRGGRRGIGPGYDHRDDRRRGVSRRTGGEYLLEDFPRPGASVFIRWEESLQNFVIVERTP